jgi:hypothetical protein
MAAVKEPFPPSGGKRAHSHHNFHRLTAGQVLLHEGAGPVLRPMSRAEILREPMQRSAEQLPIVRCPGCEQPMEPRERTPVPLSERLIDVRYVCATCGMETRRTITEE